MSLPKMEGRQSMYGIKWLAMHGNKPPAPEQWLSHFLHYSVMDPHTPSGLILAPKETPAFKAISVGLHYAI